MYDFDKSTDHFENKFAKNNPEILKSFFGTSDLKSYWIADMEFQIADPITDEIKRIANRSVYSYEFDPKGVKESISNWFKRRHSLSLDSDHFLQVPSVLTGIALLIRNFSNPGDGILIQTPVYHQFENIIKRADRKIVTNPLINTNGYYTMDFDDLENNFKSKKVKMMILCNPHNPVGRVWKKEELKRVLDLADQYQIKVISDEIHADIVYGNHKFCSFMSLTANNHMAMIGSTAKTFGMHSISNGFIYIPEDDQLKKVKGDVTGMFLDHGSSFTTFATIAAYNHGSKWVDELNDYLKTTVDWMEDFSKNEMPQLTISPVEGTYQVWLDFSRYGFSPDELKNRIITDAKLGLAHGDWFDKSGAHDQFMRLNFASPLPKIKEAFFSLRDNLSIRKN